MSYLFSIICYVVFNLTNVILIIHHAEQSHSNTFVIEQKQHACFEYHVGAESLISTR